MRFGVRFFVCWLLVVYFSEGRSQSTLTFFQKALGEQVVLQEADEHWVTSLERSWRFRQLKTWDSLWNQWANTDYQRGAYREALRKYTLSLAWRSGVKRGDAYANMGLCLMHLGPPGAATHYFVLAIQLAQLTGDHELEKHVCNYLGSHLVALGKGLEARFFFNRALYMGLKQRDYDFVADMYGNLGVNAYRLGDYEIAQGYLSRGLRVSQQVSYIRGEAAARLNLACVLGEKQMHRQAKVQFKHALSLYRILGDSISVCRSLSGLGLSHHQTGDTHLGRSFLYEGLRIAEDLSLEDKRRELYGILSSIEADLGNHRQAFLLKSKETPLLLVQNQQLLETAVANLGQFWQAEVKRMENQSLVAELALLEQRSRNFLVVGALAVLASLLLVALYLQLQRASAAERKMMEQEINLLKTQYTVFHAAGDTPSPETTLHPLNRKKIELALGGRINDSDWRILTTLTANPTLANKELAAMVALSQEGVKSALKKLYRLFELEKSKENQRLSMVIKAIKLSSEEE